MASGDVNEWSGFAARTPDPERLQDRRDQVFKDIAHDGPFAASRELALSPQAAKLLNLIQRGQWELALAHLKAAQPDLNQRDDVGNTPLSLAARAGELELVREMLRQGADPDAVGAGGMTPLGAAAFQGHELVVRDLLRKGASVSAVGLTGQPPLHLACATGQRKVVALLMKQGADWQQTNRQGRHALEEAAYFGQLPALQALVDAGADLSARDPHGLNAVHAAALGEQRQALDWLQARGVPVPGVLSQVLVDRLLQSVQP